jgi:hypothetical protein
MDGDNQRWRPKAQKPNTHHLIRMGTVGITATASTLTTAAHNANGKKRDTLFAPRVPTTWEASKRTRIGLKANERANQG